MAKNNSGTRSGRRMGSLVALALDDSMHDQLKREAQSLGISLSAYIRMILIKRKK